jgi:hypothetical protein
MRRAAVAAPSSLDNPATRTRMAAAPRADRLPADWRPKATAPTAAIDQRGSA